MQQHLPFTVCAEGCEAAEEQSDDEVRTSQVPERSEGKTKVIWQWCLPFTVLKPNKIVIIVYWIRLSVATVLTVYGIETSTPIVCGVRLPIRLQQHLPFAVCAEGCVAAEEQSDDEGRTSQVPERSEGKTKVIKE